MGSKGGDSQIEVNDYLMSMHVGVAHTVDAVTGIYYGDKLFWSGYANTNMTLSVSNLGLHGGNKKEGGVEGAINVLLGGASQVLPDALATRLGRASSADCPGFRGITSLFLTGMSSGGFYWTSNTPYLKPLWTTVLRAPKGLTAAKALIGFSNTYVPAFTTGYPYKYSAFVFSDTTDYSTEAFNDSSWFTWADSTEPIGAAEPVAGVGVKHWTRKPFTLENTDPCVIRLYGKDFATVWVNGVLIQARTPRAGDYEVSVPSSVLRVGSNLLVVLTDFLPGSLTTRTVSPMFRIIEAVQTASGGVTAEANPAHIIYECMTNTDWGMGESPDLMDAGSFEACGNALFDENFGLSMIWTRQSTVEDFTNEVLHHINGVMFTNPRTGLHTLRLVRGGYDESGLREVNPDNASLLRFSRRVWGETTNEIVVTWTNPDTEKEETVSLQDLGNISMQGAVISASRNYYGVRSSHLAMQLAARELRVASSPLCVCDVELDRSAWDILPADVVALTWPEYGIVDLPMRVGTVDYGRIGDSKVKITLVEDVFALPTSHFEEPPSTEFTDIRALPSPVVVSKVFTLPAYASAAIVSGGLPALTYPDAFAGILAKAPSGDAHSFELTGPVTNALGVPVWSGMGTLAFTGTGTLSSALNAEATSTSSFITTGSTSPEIAGFAIIGDGSEAGSEFVLFTGYDTLTGWSFKRGVLDTVPKSWAAGTAVWFISQSSKISTGKKLAAGISPQYKLLTNTSLGQLNASDAPILTGTISERPHMPLRPANVRVGDAAFGELDCSGLFQVQIQWSNRNRLTEETVVLGWTDGSTPGESGQTTVIVVTNEVGVTLDTISDLPGTSYMLSLSGYATLASVRVRVYSEVGGLLSLQAHELRLININGSFRVTDSGVRVTSTGVARIIAGYGGSAGLGEWSTSFSRVFRLNTGFEGIYQPKMGAGTTFPMSRFLVTTDGGVTFTAAQNSATSLAWGYGTKGWDGEYSGTRFSLSYNLSAEIRSVTIQTGTGVVTGFGDHTDFYPKHGGIGLNIGAAYADTTAMYIVARPYLKWDGNTINPDKMWLYSTTDGITAIQVGLMETDPADPNFTTGDPAYSQTGDESFGSSGFVQTTYYWGSSSELFKHGSRWFLKGIHATYYTDSAVPLTGWRRCNWSEPLGNRGMAFSGSTIVAGGLYDIVCSVDNGVTWASVYAVSPLFPVVSNTMPAFILAFAGKFFTKFADMTLHMYSALEATPTDWTEHTVTGFTSAAEYMQNEFFVMGGVMYAYNLDTKLVRYSNDGINFNLSVLPA